MQRNMQKFGNVYTDRVGRLDKKETYRQTTYIHCIEPSLKGKK